MQALAPSCRWIALASCALAGCSSSAPRRSAPPAGPAAATGPAPAAVVQGRDDAGPFVRVAPTAESELGEGAVLVSSDDLAANPTGAAGVTLARQIVFPPYLWVANHTLGTVSRVDTATGREEGRYWVGESPSRTAVDLEGNVWIGGRNDGRLTSIRWNREACQDRDGDGRIRTASAEELGPLNGAADPLADECVAWSGVPTPEQPSIRGIAAGPDGRVWFGFTSGGVQSIDPSTYALGPHVPAVDVPVYRRGEGGRYLPVVDDQGAPRTTDGGGVYGLVVDREGFLYASPMIKRRVSRFNVYSGRWDAVFEETGCDNYGIAIDGRDRVWVGCTDGGGGVMMLDPSQRRTHRFGLPEASTSAAGPVPATYGEAATTGSGPGVTGLAVEPQTGDVWASFWSLGLTGRLHLAEGRFEESSWTVIGTAPGNDIRGVGFDHEGFAWTHGISTDRIWRVDPSTSRLAQGFEAGLPVGGGPHYTYSDFTGSTGLSFTAPRGTWRARVAAPSPSAGLRALRWSGFVPPGAEAEARLRPLDGSGAPAGPWVPQPTEVGAAVFAPFGSGSPSSTLDLADQGLAAPAYEVEVRLATTRRDRPVVTAIELAFAD